ncbi:MULTISPECIES: hypothetical protein [unclassified Rhizobium]|jgi:hypothetical protein|uniref:hypothetical protein n=1 Tax=unclassified Rhizobium TaxID=2613769 RepID=UPI003D26C601
MVYSKNPFLQVARAGSASKPRSGLAASPAGRHMQLAKNCFALAKRYKASRNRKKYWSMVKAGRSALALARQEIRLFKQGKSIRRRSFAVHRAA